MWRLYPYAFCPATLFFDIRCERLERKLCRIREICDASLREIMRSYLHEFLRCHNENGVVRGMYKFSLTFQHNCRYQLCRQNLYSALFCYACLLCEHINHRVAVMQLHLCTERTIPLRNLKFFRYRSENNFVGTLRIMNNEQKNFPKNFDILGASLSVLLFW